MRIFRNSVFFATATVFLGSSLTYAEYTPRIINGSTATSGTYPFIASVSVDSVDGLSASGCGGSLINSEWILTAAHCFLNDAGDAVDTSAAGRTRVVLASDTLDPLSSNAEVFTVTSLIVHPSYNPNQATSANPNDNDIALLKLSGRSNQAVVQLQAFNDALSDGTQAVIMGWGATAVNAENQSTNPSNTLLAASQKIVSNSSCSSLYGGSITSNMVCAGALTAGDTTDTCQGDSGGPLVVNNNGNYVQVGVVSFGGTDTGPVCGDGNAPGVYARVSQYNSFIQQHIPGMTFASVSATAASDCAGTTIDGGLNLSIQCVVLDGTPFSTGLNLISGQLVWEWTGAINDTACVTSDTRCVVPDESLGLVLTGIPFEGNSNTLILNYDQTSTDKLRWTYQEHFIE
jgi:trypsin